MVSVNVMAISAGVLPNKLNKQYIMFTDSGMFDSTDEQLSWLGKISNQFYLE